MSRDDQIHPVNGSENQRFFNVFSGKHALQKIWKRIGNWDESKAATAIPSVGMRSVQVAPHSVFSAINRIKPLFSRVYVSKVQGILFAGKVAIPATGSHAGPSIYPTEITSAIEERCSAHRIYHRQNAWISDQVRQTPSTPICSANLELFSPE
jgi:hypothetical protein